MPGVIADRSWCYVFLNIKRDIFQPMLHIPALGYFDISVIYPHGFRRVQFVIIHSCLVKQQYLWNIAITLQPEVGCYNVCANTRCSGCSPLGEKSFWNRTITLIYLSGYLMGANYMKAGKCDNNFGKHIRRLAGQSSEPVQHNSVSMFADLLSSGFPYCLLLGHHI